VETDPLRLPVEGRAVTLLVASDMHGSLPGLDWLVSIARQRKPDILVYLGDFVTGGPERFLLEAARDMRELAPNVLLIPGNHDPRESLVRLERECYDGMKLLHKQTAFIKGFSFMGLGGSLPTPKGQSPFEMPEEQLIAPLPALLPADVWVLHHPLRGFNDTTAKGEAMGSTALREAYDEQDPLPRLVLSGHVHDAGGVMRSGPTTFVNPGPLGERSAAWVELAVTETTAGMLEG
jgi:hypothetical protein